MKFIRFEKDFEIVERLGHGGFGVVVRVKSKLDNGEYAVKLARIPEE